MYETGPIFNLLNFMNFHYKIGQTMLKIWGKLGAGGESKNPKKNLVVLYEQLVHLFLELCIVSVYQKAFTHKENCSHSNSSYTSIC